MTGEHLTISLRVFPLNSQIPQVGRSHLFYPHIRMPLSALMTALRQQMPAGPNPAYSMKGADSHSPHLI